jgi:signal transduction histidine kinase
MRYAHWIRIRAGRLIVIVLAVALYICLVIVDGMLSLPYEFAGNTPVWLPWMIFGFPALVALMFLAVSTLVWLYASDRTLARLLFGFSCSMMVVFAVQTGANSGSSGLQATGDVAATLSLLLLAILLFFFPRNIFSQTISLKTVKVRQENSRKQRSHYSYVLLFRLYMSLLVILATLSALYNGFYKILSTQIFSILQTISYIYSVIALLGILAMILISYMRTSSMRERQQRRIFVGGVILTAAPLLLLTAIPEAFGLSSRYFVDPQLSTVTIGLFPLALGYSILRYQFLVFDMYIRRAVAWLIGAVGLIVGGYLVITLSSIALSQVATAYTVFVVFVMAILAPCIWWLGKVISDSLFFNEMSHYQRIINRPDMLANEKFDLNGAAQLLTLAMVNAFQTQEVCLFVLDEETGYFRLASQLQENDSQKAARQRLMQKLMQATASTIDTNIGWLKRDDVIVERLTAAKRPLFLREARLPKEELPTGLGRYLMSGEFLESTDPLLAPVKVQGKVIGILVLGERGDRQQYAGPDFEAIYLILARFASVIETARLYGEANRHVAILNSLYNASTLPVQSFETIHDVAVLYTEIAANATAAGAQLLLYDKQDDLLHQVAYTGTGAKLVDSEYLKLLQEKDWSVWFYGGESEQFVQNSLSDVPSCLPQQPSFPVAWIPLLKGEEHLGMLILTYPRPHIFSQEEKRVLSMFASQFSVVLENADITIQLRAAFEHQKELDKLKDQFIMTASHELRTPLTAVQGYIELLKEYNLTLSAETRAEFIEKAHRSSDELTLMVSNIMDANRVQSDIESARLDNVPLAGAVTHILEILDATIRREKRTVKVALPAETFVVADSMRLRQILLNICSNALKYSPPGSGIEIRAAVDDEWVTVYIQDHGSGVPQEFQEQLFERFVRLERDMNSPTRGAGLGLSICKQLVGAMGGRIWIESSGIAGEGSTFIFTLKQGTATTEVDRYSRAHQEV